MKNRSNTIEPAKPPTWSPSRDGDDSLYESSDEAVYDIDFLSHGPRKRIPIKRYEVNDQNSMIRAYIALGRCQPWCHNFLIRTIGGKPQCFMATWFDEFKWLEYSVEKDVAFYFICYLFKHKINSSSGDAFVKGGLEIGTRKRGLLNIMDL